MKAEYDFSKGERGKFHNPDAELVTPVYLDRDVRIYLSSRAEARGVDMGDLVNDLLRREIGSEAAK